MVSLPFFICQQATNFSNPVYESVFHAESSVGTDLFNDADHKVGFRNSHVDFSNPVYEALFARDRPAKSDPLFRGSSTNLDCELSSSQESYC